MPFEAAAGAQQAPTVDFATRAEVTSGYLAVLLAGAVRAGSARCGADLSGADRSPVVDQADLLRPEQELDLKSKSEALEAQTGRQFVVATVKSLEGRTIEDYGYRLGRHWKIGDEKKDDGVILLVAPNERKVRIETGYGAGVFLTDAVSSVIIREAILPQFKSRRLWRRDRRRRRRNHQADEPAAARRRSARPQQAEQAEAARPRSASARIPVDLHRDHLLRRHRLDRAGAPAGRRYRSAAAAAASIPWVVLWGLNELSQASRGGGGWGGGGWRRRRLAAAAAAAASRAAAARSAAAGRRGHGDARLSEADHAKVSAAIAAAEAQQRRRDRRRRDRRSAIPITTSRCTGRCWC